MTDRELLELAARAAGWWDAEFNCYNGPVQWNPLTDPGDALRLAVALHIELNFQAPDSKPYWTAIAFEHEHLVIASATGPDPLAATMRAIVLAVAEIGKGMKT